MDRPALYPVCPYRNVPAAFARFHGRDAGGVERFFDDPSGRDPFAALARACERFEQRAAMLASAGQALLLLVCAAVQVYGVRALSRWATHPQLPLHFGAQPARVRARLVAREALPRARRVLAAIAQLNRARLSHLRGDWLAEPQLPLLLGPQRVTVFAD